MSRGIFRYASVTLLSLVSTLAFVSGFAYASKMLLLKEVVRFHEVLALMNTALGSTMAEDVLLTICLSFLLIRSRTGSNRTNTLINTLVQYTVRNGLITSTCAFLDVFLRAVSPNTLAYLPFFLLLSELYIATLLATLNARNSLRIQNNYTEPCSIKFEAAKPGIDTGQTNLEFFENTVGQHGQTHTVLGDNV